jgi:hypothetical protein
MAVATGYKEICTAPCKVSLPAGSHTFGVSQPGQPPVEAPGVTLPAGTADVKATYTDNSGVRIAGWIVGGVSVVVGGIVMVAAIGSEKVCPAGSSSCFDSTKLNTGVFIAGAGIMGIGAGVGVLMTRVRDSAEVDVSDNRMPLSRVPGVRLTATF